MRRRITSIILLVLIVGGLAACDSPTDNYVTRGGTYTVTGEEPEGYEVHCI